MIRGLTLAAVIVTAAPGLAVDPPVKPAAAEQSADVLEAQLATRQAHVRAAEVAVRAEKLKLLRLAKAQAAGSVPAEELDQARVEADAAAAQLEVRKAELHETEARLKLTRNPAAGPKAAAGPRVAVFNMAAVMRDYEKAKYQVYLLNQRRTTESANLLKLRDEHGKTQGRLAKEADPAAKDRLRAELRTVTFRIQEEDARINKLLNDEASRIIGELYDDIQAEVDRIAEKNGYAVVFAYPDAVTTAERGNPHLKELKLKPPAAQPFYVAKDADITEEVIRSLNAAHPPRDADGTKVDLSKLNLTGSGPVGK